MLGHANTESSMDDNICQKWFAVNGGLSIGGSTIGELNSRWHANLDNNPRCASCFEAEAAALHDGLRRLSTTTQEWSSLTTED